MLFSQQTYIERRKALRAQVGSGLILLFGNNDAPMNYPANAYKFRQDSSFLYFFAQKRDGLVGVLDCDSGEDTLVGDDIDIDDIVWYGSVQSVGDMAQEAGVAHSAPMSALALLVCQAKAQGRAVHYLPPYRHDTQIQLMDLLGIHPREQRAQASLPLIHAVVKLRSTKTAEEIAEIERACAIGYQMHTTAMALSQAHRHPGITEHQIGGSIDGVAARLGSVCSFQSIVSMHGEVLHGYPSTQPLEPGRLLLVDAGAETLEHYCSDHTRTTPISGHFTQRQREVYSIVADCHDLALTSARPGQRWWDVHMDVCRLMTDRLKQLGLMRGDTDEAVRAGAHALFMPHGLGHMMGMDVHDMEGLGQEYVGYDAETRPSTQFGTASLRMARRLEPGFVITDEPGIYFIPALIDLWRSEKHCEEFLCFEQIEKYKDFGGVRIEDDVLITPEGCRFLGTERIPYHAQDVESWLEQQQG